MIATGKRYIQKHVQERRNPKHLPTAADLQALWQRIEAQATRAEGQIALLPDEERTDLLLMGAALRLKQEDLALEIDRMLARAEREKYARVGDLQHIGGVLAKMNGEQDG